MTDDLNKLLSITSALEWTGAFTITPAEAEAFADPDWLIENLLIAGHLIAIVGAPNSGKTTIARYAAALLASKVVRVSYINCDVAQSDVKELVQHASNNGYVLLLPDFKVGLSSTDVLLNLAQLNNQEGDYSGVVFIFDTFKKFVDILNKRSVKDILKLFRGLTAKGMTIILLCHTNKHKGEDGSQVFEGTGDIRADVDELIYLVPQKNTDGSMTVSTNPDKVRGKFEPITFKIDTFRNVSQLDQFVDIAELRAKEQQLEDDQPIIELITEAIQAEHFTESKILAFVKESGAGIGWRKIKDALDRYTGKYWSMERALKNNAKQYFLLNTLPPNKGISGESGRGGESG